MKIIARILPLVAGGLLVAVCAAADSNPQAQALKVLRFGVHVSAMGKLDPHLAAGSQDRALADMVFNGLLRYRPGEAPNIEPDLARAIPEFEMIGGRQVWTLFLRKGVMFHPGPKTEAYELTADDVVYSLHKSADRNLCTYSGEYEGLAIEKVDRYTVRIVPKQPLSPILFLPKLTNYAGGFIVSERAIESMGYSDFARHPVGTGPFRFASHEPGEKVILRAHELYFRGRPLLDGVELRFLADAKRREAAFRAGELDVITASGDAGWIEKMENQPGAVIDFHGVGEVLTAHFNIRQKPMDDVRVRRAIAYALSREAFLNTTNPRLAGSVYSPVPAQFLPGGIHEEEAARLGLIYPTDLKRAQRLLVEAGYPDGFTLDLVSSEKRMYRRCYQMLREQLARIGITCRVAYESHSDMHKRIRTNPQPIVLYTAWRPNADVFLSRFFHSDSTVVTGLRPDTNFSHYDRIDKLIEAARLEIDPQKQIVLWGQAQIRILSDMAAYPLMFSNQCYVRRTHVDYGHPLTSTMALYPQFTEKTRLNGKP